MTDTITINTRDGDVVVPATVIETLAVHQEVTGDGWNLAHVATGMTFGITGLPTEAEAVEAARCVLANSELAHVLEAATQEEAVARAEALGTVTELVRGIVQGLEDERFKRQHEEGVYTPEALIGLIVAGQDRIENVDIDHVTVGIEAATDDEKRDILRAIASECEKATRCADKYSEPGYADPEFSYVFLGSWWHRPDGDLRESKLVSIIESCGGAVEWDDEWAVCSGDDCFGAVRTSPDSYHWTKSYVEWDCEVVCCECMEDEDNRRDFAESELEGSPHMADTLDWDLDALGYVRLDEDFQRGLYGGQSADPNKIAEALEGREITRFVFQIDSVGQFDARFSCWVHEDEMPEGGLDLAHSEANGSDPVVAMKQAMNDADRQMASLPDGPGVKVAKCNPDGTATVRVVSPEDFIAGKALD